MAFWKWAILSAVSRVSGIEIEGLLPHSHHSHRHISKTKRNPLKNAVVATAKQVEAEQVHPDSQHVLPLTQKIDVIPATKLRNSVQPVTNHPDSSVEYPVAQQLQEELVEMKERQVQIGQLREGLRADVALLKETTMLKRVSLTEDGRRSAEDQLIQAAQLVKRTEGMLQEIQQGSADTSQVMIKEASRVRSIADALSSEASEQLRLFSHDEFSHKSSPLAEATKPIVETSPMANTAKNASVNKSDDDLDLEDIEDENL